jgi:Uma2 family endonuclease
MASVNLKSERIVGIEKKKKYISKEEYRTRYADREDGFKYEWNNGIIERTESMKKYQALIEAAILRLFFSTEAFKNHGMICAEMETDTSDTQLRKPDLAFYTANQLNVMDDDISQTPSWVCEVISKTDDMEDVQKKIVEYFAAGVQCVWIVLPKNEMVYVYTSVSEVTICQGETVCSGAPVMLDFKIEARRLFEKINV